METTLKSRLNIHGIIDLDQMASVLTTLIEQVDRQNQVIADLQHSLSFYVSKQSFVEKMTGMEQALSKSNMRIDAIQEAATAMVQTKKISAGNLASSNYKQITHLTKLVKECTTRQEHENTKKELSSTQHRLSTLRGDFDRSLTVIDQLSNSQLHQSQRIGSIETAVAGKLDRSECDHLESLVAKVLLYDEFKRDTSSAVNQLQDFRSEAQHRFDAYEIRLVDFSQQLQQTLLGLSRTASKKEAHALAKELQAHERKLNECAGREWVEKIDHSLNEASLKLLHANENILSLQNEAEAINNKLMDKASVQSVRECVTRKHYEQAVTALGKELELKAARSHVAYVKDELDKLVDRVSMESKKVTVAMRFVDWFTHRGENYEHNMQIIDKHLKGLVVPPPSANNAIGEGGSSSHVHSYFLPGNKVIFDPAPDHAP